MRNYIIALFVVAACLSCGGNNPVPTLGMHPTGLKADEILSTQNTVPVCTRCVVTNLGRNQHSEKSTKEIITLKDDFSNADLISPAKEFDVPQEHFIIQAEAGGTIRYDKTGSTVIIPPDALVDKEGNPVQGDVDVSYREFHTQKEIFFSGIPMDFEVNGEKHFFESAGMIDISASQKGKEVFVKKGKEIRFKMSTDNTHQEVKLYELDKKKKKWTELGEAPVINTNSTFSINQKTWGPVYASKQVKSLKRGNVFLNINSFELEKDANTNKNIKKLNIGIRIFRYYNRLYDENKEKYKQARIFTKISFVLSGMNKKQFRRMMRDLNMPVFKNRTDFAITEQTKIDFVDAEYPNKITLRFTYNDKQVDVPVELSYGYTQSKRLKKKYFDQLLAFNMNDFPGRTTEIVRNEQVIDHYDSIAVNAIWYNKSIVQREFTSKNFGILNCDQPQKLPTGMIANAAFNADGESISPYDVTLVDFDKNCMFTYYNSMFPKFQFNPNTRNFVFTILNNGNMAFILPDEFEKIQRNGDMNFNLHVITMDKFEKLMEKLFPTKTEYSYTL